MNIESALTGYWHHPNGYDLFFRYHPVNNPRAHVILIHGLGEHSGRHLDTIERFNALGLGVFAYDHYGHGRSDGKRGTVLKQNQLDQDLQWVLEECRRKKTDALPVIIFGHSLGGLVVANRLAQPTAYPWIQGAILSSPALKTYVSEIVKWFAERMQKWLPETTIKNGLPVKVSHREEVNRALKNDPLAHQEINGALALFIEQAGAYVRPRAAVWKMPTLLLYAGEDKFIDPKGSREFARRAPKSVVTAQEFPKYYHEVFHETDPEPVYQAVENWLEKLIGKGSA